MNTHYDRLEVRAHQRPWLRETISMTLVQVSAQGKGPRYSIAQPLTLRALTDDDMMVEQPETFSLRPDEAQQFMDELWRVGIRPTAGAGSVGQIDAVNRHLEDMRSLVFKANGAAQTRRT